MTGGFFCLLENRLDVTTTVVVDLTSVVVNKAFTNHGH
jgi:hypothetical protein